MVDLKYLYSVVLSPIKIRVYTNCAGNPNIKKIGQVYRLGAARNIGVESLFSRNLETELKRPSYGVSWEQSFGGFGPFSLLY